MLQVPDSPPGPVDLWEQFTFHQKRDAVGFANEMLDAVDDLVEEILSGFERAMPERFRELATDFFERVRTETERSGAGETH